MGKFSAVLFIILLVAGVDAGIKFGMPEYNYRVFKSDLKEVIKFEELRDSEEKYKNRIIKFAKQSGVDLSDENVFVVDNGDGTFSFEIKWSVVVDYYGQYQKQYDYAITDADF